MSDSDSLQSPCTMNMSNLMSQDLTMTWLQQQQQQQHNNQQGLLYPPIPPMIAPPPMPSPSLHHNFHHQHQRYQSSPSPPSTVGEGPHQIRKLFIGGLHYDTTSEQLRAFFGRWGPIVDAIVMRDPATKQSRGFGFVTFATFSGAELAMANRPHIIVGKQVDSKRAIPREQMTNIFHSPLFDYDIPAGCKLEVTGIQCNFHTVEALRLHFEKYGVIDQIELFILGRGFIVFEKEEDAIRCLALGEHVINGQLVSIAPFNSSDYYTEGFPELK